MLLLVPLFLLAVTTASAQPTVSMGVGDPYATEAGTFGSFTIVRSGGDQSVPLPVFFSLGGSATFNADYVVPVTTTVSPGISIPDSGPASLYPSEMTVSGLPGLVSKVTVTLSGLSHTFPEDLDVLLVGPDGTTSVLLMSDAGGGADVNGVTLTFDDAAAAFLPTTQITTGTVKPTNGPEVAGSGDIFPLPAPAGPYFATLSAFAGRDPNGTWKLFIRDDAGGDSGFLSGWSLRVC